MFQVSAVMSSGVSRNEVQPALGISWANMVTTRLMLSRTGRYINAPLATGSPNHFQGLASNSPGDMRNSPSDLTQSANESPIDQSAGHLLRQVTAVFAPHLASTSCHYIVTAHGVQGIT